MKPVSIQHLHDRNDRVSVLVLKFQRSSGKGKQPIARTSNSARADSQIYAEILVSDQNAPLLAILIGLLFPFNKMVQGGIMGWIGIELA